MMGLDVTSDAFTKSEMTKADIERALAALAPGAVLDLSGRSLNGVTTPLRRGHGSGAVELRTAIFQVRELAV